MHWQDAAACRGMHELFSPADDEKEGDEVPEHQRAQAARELARVRTSRIRLAQKVCGECPVRWKCLDAALTDPDLDKPHIFAGIWAGLERHGLLEIRKRVYRY